MGEQVGRLGPGDWIGRIVNVVMDRPLGSLHPQYGFVYELNCGYVPGYIAPDGAELDAYIVGTHEILTACDGVVVAVIRRHDDVADKRLSLLTTTRGVLQLSQKRSRSKKQTGIPKLSARSENSNTPVARQACWVKI